MALINIALCESSRTLKETSSAESNTWPRCSQHGRSRRLQGRPQGSCGGQAVLLREGLWCCNLGFSAQESEHKLVCLIDSWCLLRASGLKGGLRGAPEKFERERMQIGFPMGPNPCPISRSSTDMNFGFCAPYPKIHCLEFPCNST